MSELDELDRLRRRAQERDAWHAAAQHLAQRANAAYHRQRELEGELAAARAELARAADIIAELRDQRRAA